MLVEDFESIRQRLQEIESDQMPPIRVSAEDGKPTGNVYIAKSFQEEEPIGDEFFGTGGLTWAKVLEGAKVVEDLRILSKLWCTSSYF